MFEERRGGKRKEGVQKYYVSLLPNKLFNNIMIKVIFLSDITLVKRGYIFIFIGMIISFCIPWKLLAVRVGQES